MIWAYTEEEEMGAVHVFLALSFMYFSASASSHSRAAGTDMVHKLPTPGSRTAMRFLLNATLDQYIIHQSPVQSRNPAPKDSNSEKFTASKGSLSILGRSKC